MLRILIPNYAEYQHYRDRNPPWIKIHKKILDDYKFMSLQGKYQMLLVCLWVLASEHPPDEGRGVVKLEGLNELVWRLRGLEAMSGGGADSLQLLQDKGFILVEGSLEHGASTALARRTTERETERETEGEERSPGGKPRGRAEPASKSWTREAAEDWDERFGKGSAAPGRIGAALSPLVKAHGWPEVRPVWQRYLGEKDPTYASPQDFKAKYASWADGSIHVGGESIEAENRRQSRKFLDGEKPLTSSPRALRMPDTKGEP